MISRFFANRGLTRQHDSVDDDTPQGASRGQILVLFAFFLTAMIGMLGLAVDLGFAYSQRRTVQNAADLSAVAGARAVARFQPGSPTVALDDVQEIVEDNHLGNTSTFLVECTYIDQFGQDVGDCSLIVPPNATGVHVEVSETHQTFFVRVIPGAPVAVTTRARANAQIERMDLAGMDSPFMLCGMNTKLSNGGTMDILLSDYVMNPNAVGRTFRLTGPNPTDIARCGTPSTGTSYGARWRGLSDKEANNGKRVVLPDSTTSSWWNPKIGSPSTNTATLTNKVNGIEGCEELAAKPFDCIMLIPIATSYDSTIRRMKVTKVLGFRVWQDSSSSSTFYGTLLDDYLVFGASVPMSVDLAPWCRDCGSVVVVRLAG